MRLLLTIYDLGAMYLVSEVYTYTCTLVTNIIFDLLFISYRYHDQLDAIEAKFPIEENQVSIYVNVCMYVWWLAYNLQLASSLKGGPLVCGQLMTEVGICTHSRSHSHKDFTARTLLFYINFNFFYFNIHVVPFLFCYKCDQCQLKCCHGFSTTDL